VADQEVKSLIEIRISCHDLSPFLWLTSRKVRSASD